MWFSLPNFACYDVTAWVSWFAFAGFGVDGARLAWFWYVSFGCVFCGIPAVLWRFVCGWVLDSLWIWGVLGLWFGGLVHGLPVLWVLCGGGLV